MLFLFPKNEIYDNITLQKTIFLARLGCFEVEIQLDLVFSKMVSFGAFEDRRAEDDSRRFYEELEILSEGSILRGCFFGVLWHFK